MGTLNISAAAFIPFPGPNGTVTVPAIISGQLFGVDCNPGIDDCTNAPIVFGFNIIGAGTLTAIEFNMGQIGNGQYVEGIDNPYVSWAGIAIETPEPSSWLLLAGALSVILVLKWKAC